MKAPENGVFFMIFLVVYRFAPADLLEISESLNKIKIVGECYQQYLKDKVGK